MHCIDIDTNFLGQYVIAHFHPFENSTLLSPSVIIQPQMCISCHAAELPEKNAAHSSKLRIVGMHWHLHCTKGKISSEENTKYIPKLLMANPCVHCGTFNLSDNILPLYLLVCNFYNKFTSLNERVVSTCTFPFLWKSKFALCIYIAHCTLILPSARKCAIHALLYRLAYHLLPNLILLW